MARSEVRIEWRNGTFEKILRSQGMHSIMQHYGSQVCARANQLSMPRAKYGFKVAQGRKRFWKARIYTGNYAAMVDAHKRNTLTKVI